MKRSSSLCLPVSMVRPRARRRPGRPGRARYRLGKSEHEQTNHVNEAILRCSPLLFCNARSAPCATGAEAARSRMIRQRIAGGGGRRVRRADEQAVGVGQRLQHRGILRAAGRDARQAIRPAAKDAARARSPGGRRWRARRRPGRRPRTGRAPASRVARERPHQGHARRAGRRRWTRPGCRAGRAPAWRRAGRASAACRAAWRSARSRGPCPPATSARCTRSWSPTEAPPSVTSTSAPAARAPREARRERVEVVAARCRGRSRSPPAASTMRREREAVRGDDLVGPAALARAHEFVAGGQDGDARAAARPEARRGSWRPRARARAGRAACPARSSDLALAKVEARRGGRGARPARPRSDT